MSAMAYVMLTEHLYDADFVRTHCVGFDATPMPVEVRILSVIISWSIAMASKDAAMGRSDHRCSCWNDRAHRQEYATLKPSILYQGYGMQRRAYGEQVVRAGCVLAAITGNVGVPGGWASGLGLQAPDGGGLWTVFPPDENPVKASIPVFLWTEAVLRGKS